MNREAMVYRMWSPLASVVPLAIGLALTLTGSWWVRVIGVILCYVGGAAATSSWKWVPLGVLLCEIMLFNDQTLLTTGFPSVGLNGVDLTVLFMAGWILAGLRHRSWRQRVTHDHMSRLLAALVLTGAVYIVVGVLAGAQLRWALRDVRFFIYVPVLYMFTAHVLDWDEKLARRALIAACMIAFAQLAAIASGLLVLYPIPGARWDLLPNQPYTSAWHFLGEWAFFPMFIAIWFISARRVGRLWLVANWAGVLAWSTILVLSFARTLQLSIAGAYLFTVLLNYRRRVLPLLAVPVTAVTCVLAVQLGLTQPDMPVQLWAAVTRQVGGPTSTPAPSGTPPVARSTAPGYQPGSGAGPGTGGGNRDGSGRRNQSPIQPLPTATVGPTPVSTPMLVPAPLPTRAPIEADLAITTRLADAVWTTQHIVSAPLGHGLGSGELITASYADYPITAGIHMGYLWIAYRTGILGLVLVLLVFGLTVVRVGRQARSLSPEPYASAALFAFSVILFSLLLSAFASTVMVNFVAVPFWGVLVGYLAAEKVSRRDRGSSQDRPVQAKTSP